MPSIWSTTTDIPERPPLPGDTSIDPAVIGGGLAGILTAYFLQQKGVSVLVLEADRIGSGQTQNTTAKISCQHNLIYHHLLQTFGWEKALKYAHANLEAIEAYQELIQKHQINCGFRNCPSYLYTTRDPFPLEQEMLAARKLGIAASFTTQTGSFHKRGPSAYRPRNRIGKAYCICDSLSLSQDLWLLSSAPFSGTQLRYRSGTGR